MAPFRKRAESGRLRPKGRFSFCGRSRRTARASDRGFAAFWRAIRVRRARARIVFRHHVGAAARGVPDGIRCGRAGRSRACRRRIHRLRPPSATAASRRTSAIATRKRFFYRPRANTRSRPSARLRARPRGTEPASKAPKKNRTHPPFPPNYRRDQMKKTALATVAVLASHRRPRDRVRRRRAGRRTAPCGPPARSRTTSASCRDYRYRGISQSKLKPALQGGIDYANGPIYVGTWAVDDQLGQGLDEGLQRRRPRRRRHRRLRARSSEKGAPVEWDLYGGTKGDIIKDTLTYDVGVLAYIYLGEKFNDIGLTEPGHRRGLRRADLRRVHRQGLDQRHAAVRRAQERRQPVLRPERQLRPGLRLHADAGRRLPEHHRLASPRPPTCRTATTR